MRFTHERRTSGRDAREKLFTRLDILDHDKLIRLNFNREKYQSPMRVNNESIGFFQADRAGLSADLDGNACTHALAAAAQLGAEIFGKLVGH